MNQRLTNYPFPYPQAYLVNYLFLRLDSNFSIDVVNCCDTVTMSSQSYSGNLASPTPPSTSTFRAKGRTSRKKTPPKHPFYETRAHGASKVKIKPKFYSHHQKQREKKPRMPCMNRKRSVGQSVIFKKQARSDDWPTRVFATFPAVFFFAARFFATRKKPQAAFRTRKF